MTKCARLLSTAAVFATVVNLHADENLFGYTYTTDVLPKGKWEVEQCVTGRPARKAAAISAWISVPRHETG